MPLNLVPLLKHLTIRDKDLNLIPLDLDIKDEFAWSWAQRKLTLEVERQYNAGKPVRIITLKARQIGISTVTEGIIFNWAFLHPGMHGLVMANETGTSQEIFDKTKYYWESWPFNHLYTPKYSTKNYISWKETQSSIKVATSKNVTSGRGTTINALHATECAYYHDPYTLMNGLNQTIPHKHGTIIVLESTANGTGNWWHDKWRDAENGEGDYVPLFFPWYQHPEYRLSTTLSTSLELTPYERFLQKLGCNYENIAWRRWKIKDEGGDEDYFKQEYPATPDEAFITSGQPIFSPDALRDCYQPTIQTATHSFPGQRGNFKRRSGSVRFYPDSAGNWTIYKSPVSDQRFDRYFLAGDPSRTVTGDPACIQIINRATYEQVAVWHGHIDPVAFADEMMLGGEYYNYAMLCPEVEGGGQSTIAIILRSGYPSVWQHRKADKPPSTKLTNDFGFSQNWSRKQWIIGELQHMIFDRSVIFHDTKTYNQLLSYTRLGAEGEMGPSDRQGHDDAVMAFAMAVTCSKTQGPFFEYETPRPSLDSYRSEYNSNRELFVDEYTG